MVFILGYLIVIELYVEGVDMVVLYRVKVLSMYKVNKVFKKMFIIFRYDVCYIVCI